MICHVCLFQFYIRYGDKKLSEIKVQFGSARAIMQLKIYGIQYYQTVTDQVQDHLNVLDLKSS